MRRSVICRGVNREAGMQENEIYVHMVPLVPSLCQIVHAFLNEANKQNIIKGVLVLFMFRNMHNCLYQS